MPNGHDLSLATRIVEVASLEVGVREDELNNTGARIREYQAATWLEPAAWPWCAAFCCWVLREACRLAGRADVALCPDASAYGWEKWGRRHGWLVLPEEDPCEPGDFVTFDFSHIGIVTADLGSRITTIEGNTNGKGDRDSESGDGVWWKTRERHLVKSFIRVPPA